MGSKLGAAFFCLLFALPFGGVGLGAAYVFVTTVIDGISAKDWVLVKADVLKHKHPNVTYRYTFDGKQYTGDRLGSSRIGGTDNIDDWHPRMDSFIETALQEGKPISVYLNPDNPSESMVDRTIRWGFLVFLLPFALAFGGVGVGALWMLQKILRGDHTTFGVGPSAKKISLRQAQAERMGAQGERVAKASNSPGERRTSQRIRSDAGSNVLMLWVFTFFWNAISFPIAALFIPQMIQSREWLGLLVLLFPLIGVLLIWGAINGTIHYFRRGGVSMMLADELPRVGGIVQGHVAFNRGVTAGDTFKIKLLSIETRQSGEDSTDSTIWSKEIDSRATDVGGEKRLQFRFDVPRSCKPTDMESSPRYRWRIEASPKSDKVETPYGFQVTLDESLMKDDFEALEPEPIKDAPELPEVERMLAGAGVGMDERKRQAFNQMTPEQRAMAMKAAKAAPIIKKVIIGIVVVFVAAQVIGFVAPLMAMFGQ